MNIYSLLNDVENREFATFYDQKLPETLETIKNALSSDKATDEIDNLIKDFTDIISTVKVSDCLSKYLNEEKTDVFYYIGINDFVFDYYKENPNSKWKIKAVLQCGFPFAFAKPKGAHATNYSNTLIRSYLEEKKWSLFVFTKKPCSKVTIGFDNRNTFSNFNAIKNQRQPDVDCQIDDLPEDYKGTPFVACDFYNEDHYGIIDEFLKNEKIPAITNAQFEELKYSFTEIPSEYFRLDYLDYLSRYKKSVVGVFGYPEKDEKIKKLKNIVEFINAPGKDHVWPDIAERKNHVLIKDFFFKNGKLEQIVRIGEQNVDFPTFWEDYEVHSYIISPYYLYSLLSSELVTDYYSDHYEEDKYYDANTPLPLEDCIFIEMSSSKMRDKKYEEKYERDIKPTLKAQDMISSKTFSNTNAKGSIEKYLVEIKNNIDSGSYYSATIVMGSVLEAFLIDWLSELDGKNYFEEDYLVTDKKHKYQRRADLMDYIDIIQKRRPDWIDGAKKATEIRKKRNLVHAKLYIAEGEITQEICYEMLRNLEVIINNRWPKQ